MTASFIDRLLDAAKRHKSVKRLYISQGEIKTDPIDARDHLGNHNGDWPAAWAIAKAAGVSGGCGNHGQHQISLSRTDIELAYPPEYVQARAEVDELLGLLSDVKSRQEQAIEAVVAEWKASEAGRALAAEQVEVQRRFHAASIRATELRPAWATSGGQWFDVKEKANADR